MFTKHNILFVRYANPQNDTIYIEYGTDDDVNFYYMPVMPLDSYEWQILFKAGYDTDKIYLNTLDWIKNPYLSKYKHKEDKQKIFVKLVKLPTAELQVSWENNYLIFDASFDQKLYEKNVTFDIAITEKNNPLMVYENVNVNLPNNIWKTHREKVDITYFSNYSLYIASKNKLSFAISHG